MKLSFQAMSCPQVIDYVEGSTQQEAVTVSNLNLSGYTVTVHIQFRDGSYFSKACTVTSAASGQFQLLLEPDDEIPVGRHEMRFKFDDGADNVFRVPTGRPLTLMVRKKLES